MSINQILQRSLFELGGQPISLLWIIQLLIALIAVGIIAHFIKNILKYRVLPRFGIKGGSRVAIAKLTSLGIGAFGYLIVLQVIGIDLSSIAVIIGSLGIGIGFGLQDITKNLLSGLTVSVECKLRVDDFVEFDNIAGYIKEISIRIPQLDLTIQSLPSTVDPSTLQQSEHLFDSAAIEVSKSQPCRFQSVSEVSLQAWLPQISYFQNFNELQIRRLIEMGFRQQLAPSEVLIRQGATAREFYIVLSGKVGGFYEGEQNEKQLFTFETGQYFGELPLMLGVPYKMTLKALTKTVLYVIREAGFKKLLQDYPALADEVGHELSIRKELLEESYEELRAIGFYMETETSSVNWIRQRLRKIFSISCG